MTEMILMKCDTGSKAAVVLCPKCGRISRQILGIAFYLPNRSYDFIRPHVCPICGADYAACNQKNQEQWMSALTRYEWNADQYNQSVKVDYAQKQESESSPKSASVFTPPFINWHKPEQEEIHDPISKNEISLNPETPSTHEPVHIMEEEMPEQLDAQNQSVKVISERFGSGSSETSNRLSALQEEATQPYGELERKIERWKRELLDTGKRNKMINYRETKRATLKILEPEASVLFNQLALSDKPLTFQKPINKDTDLRTYSVIALMETLSYTLNVQVGDIKTAGTIIEREKTLKNLRSKAKLAQEEQGTNILYLCFGFIYWRAQNRDSSPWFKAPLLMMPVTLGLKSLNAPYTLSRYDDEIEVNPTLDYLFSTEYNIDLPKFELRNKDSFDDYLTQIEDIVDKRGWKVVREVSLGLLSFLKISMYHDLNENRERMIDHPVLMAMAGDRKALGELPAVAEHFNFDAVKPEEWHEVVDSDSSQEEAILLSKLGVSFVMQGPPGTGKSQTITNIIAEALADGKKILFVSEKAAALEVVLKRLTEVHLDDFCLSLRHP